MVRYPLPAGGEKVVHYYAARAAGGVFRAKAETDELRWCTVARARALLSYPHDGAVLYRFAALPDGMATVLLVRHAKAGERADWSGDDELRPLSAAGDAQAAALGEMLALWRPQRAHAAPRLRCTQTLAPLAAALGATVTDEPLLAEEIYAARPLDGMRRLAEIALPGAAVAVCSQGGVIPDLVTRLAGASGVDAGTVCSKKGSVWVLSLCPAGEAAGSRAGAGSADGVPGSVPGWSLVAADYYPSALPRPR